MDEIPYRESAEIWKTRKRSLGKTLGSGGSVKKDQLQSKASV